MPFYLFYFYTYVFFPEQEQEPSRSGLIPVELVKTIDGDTIKIKYEGKEQNVRYLLIDTPETNHPRLGKQPFGEKAKERNRELMNSGKLEIEFDIGGKTDKYDRLLAYIYIDGVSVQEKLLEEGLARVAYVYPPNTRHLDAYKKAEEKAKKAESVFGHMKIMRQIADSTAKYQVEKPVTQPHDPRQGIFQKLYGTT